MRKIVAALFVDHNMNGWVHQLGVFYVNFTGHQFAKAEVDADTIGARHRWQVGRLSRTNRDAIERRRKVEQIVADSGGIEIHSLPAKNLDELFERIAPYGRGMQDRH